MENTEILDKLAIRTVDYFKNELFIEVNDDYKIISVEKIDYLDITVLISLSCDMSGSIGMSVSNELAYEMIKNFISDALEEEELHELSSENVAETLNITLGNILKDLSVLKNGGTVDISTPYTLHNSVSITKKESGNMYLCELKLNNEIIILSYFL